MTVSGKRRRRQWPYALALVLLVPGSLAIPLYSGYGDARAKDTERERVVPAGGPATWQGATWRFLGISEAPVDERLPTGAVHAVAAVTVTPHDRTAAERLRYHCTFQLRDRTGRIWAATRQFAMDLRIRLELDLPGNCQVRDGFNRRPIAPGEEHLMFAPFALPRGALPSAELRVVLSGGNPAPVLRFAR